MSAVVLGEGRFSWLLCISALACCATGCYQQHSQDIAVPYVAFGIGVSNYVQIGMTLEEVKKNVRTISIATEKESRDGFVGMLLPKRTVGHVVTIPSLGAMFRVKDYESQISVIEFDISSTISSNRFMGVIAGFVLTNRSVIKRADIVALLGAPTPIGTNDVREYIRTGKTFSWNLDTAHEMLYYYSNGVYFRLSTGVVDRVMITVPFPRDSKKPSDNTPPRKAHFLRGSNHSGLVTLNLRYAPCERLS